jgi:hypothetical protein
VAGKLKVQSVYFTSVTNQYIYQLPNDLPKSYQDKNNVLLFIDGNLQSFNDFNIYDNKLITSPATGAYKISMYVFYREDSTGSSFKLYEELIEFARLVDYNGKPSYNLPIVPESVEDSIGFSFSGQLGKEVQHSWTFDGAKVIFNPSPTTDTLMFVYGAEDVENGYSQPKQYEWRYNNNNNDSATNSHVFKLSDTPADLSYVLFAKGKVVPKSTYTVTNNEIRISKSDLTLTEGDYVRFLWVINKVANAYADLTVTKSNVVVNPNKVVPHVSTFISPVSAMKVAAPINDNYILVFIKGLKQEKDVDWKLQGSDENEQNQLRTFD